MPFPLVPVALDLVATGGAVLVDATRVERVVLAGAVSAADEELAAAFLVRVEARVGAAVVEVLCFGGMAGFSVGFVGA